MNYKGIIDEANLEESKLIFKKTIDVICGTYTNRYTESDKDAIILIASEIKLNFLAKKTLEITTSQSSNLSQTVLAYCSDIYIYGMANVISSKSNELPCAINRHIYKKSSNQYNRLEIQQLAGINGGGKILLSYILSDALINKDFDYVTLTAATDCSKMNPVRDKLIPFYENIINSFPSLSYFRDGRVFYYYKRT